MPFTQPWDRYSPGHQDIVLVEAHTKESQGDKSLIENAAFDAILMRQLGLDFTSAAALQGKALHVQVRLNRRAVRQCGGQKPR